MKDIINDFLLMIQFFTRIPIKKSLPAEAKNFRRGLVFLPFIGFLTSFCQYLLICLLKNYLPSSIVAFMATVLPIILTGGLHIDGLGDSFDGFFAFTFSKDKILEIMQDSSSGTFALCSIISNILLQYLSIEYIIRKNKIEVLLVILMFSKLYVLFIARWGRPAKSDGTGNLFIGNISSFGLAISVMYSSLISILFVSLSISLILFLTGALGAYLFYLLSYKKIQGVTGDTMGASQEITTVVMLIVYCALI